MSLYDANVASKAESQAIRDNLARLRRINEAGETPARRVAKLPDYLKRRPDIAAYRPQGYLTTDSFRPEQRARRDAKVRTANEAWRDSEQSRYRQRRKAGKVNRKRFE